MRDGHFKPTLSSSLCGHKRSRPEAEEVAPDWCCAVCWEVLLDVVTLPCGHSLDQRCLQRIMAATSGGRGQRAWPVCRHALPASPPAINVQMRTTVQRLFPEQVGLLKTPNDWGRTHGACHAGLVTASHGDTQVKRRRAEVSKEVAHEALETALATEDLVALRRKAEAGWRNEQDVDRLSARAVRVCEQIPALAPRLERATPDTTELVKVGLEAVQTAAYEGVDVNAETEEAGEETGYRWLLLAAEDGLVQSVEALLEAGAELNHAANHGCTAVYMAASNGHLDAVRALVAAGAEMHHADNNGFTALYAAANFGHVEIVQVLAEAGAEVDHASIDGCTALYAPAQDGHLEAVRALLEAGAEVDHADSSGATALYIASQNGHLDVVGALVEAGAEVNHVRTSGATALG